ncbi:MAG TPA: YIP1 family protein [Acidobacteriaceae bacterium]
MSSAGSTALSPISPAGRVAAAFVSPTRLFLDIKRNTTWWPAFLLLLLGGMLFSYAVQKQVGWQRVYETTLRQNPKQEARLAQMPPEQMAGAKAMGAKFTQGIAWGFPIIILISTAVCAAVLLGTLNFGFGGQARFSELFAVYLYASLPLLIHTVLAVIALFAGLDSGSFLITNPVGSNLGYYLSQDTAPWITAIASSFDVFGLWMLVLLVLGCSIVARVSRASAAIAVVGWWVLMLVLKVGAAALQS